MPPIGKGVPGLPAAKKKTRRKKKRKVAKSVSQSDVGQGKKPARRRRKATAQSMAAEQRSISVSEFFTKNRHLLGFDNLRKALLTTVKEAVDNSLDACEEAGITPEIWVQIDPAGSKRFRVTIQDNGTGIEGEALERVFEPFFTTKTKGTGLGMAISHRIIDAHHGTIQVAPCDSPGAAFAIKLPIKLPAKF